MQAKDRMVNEDGWTKRLPTSMTHTSMYKLTSTCSHSISHVHTSRGGGLIAVVLEPPRHGVCEDSLHILRLSISLIGRYM